MTLTEGPVEGGIFRPPRPLTLAPIFINPFYTFWDTPLKLQMLCDVT